MTLPDGVWFHYMGLKWGPGENVPAEYEDKLADHILEAATEPKEK